MIPVSGREGDNVAGGSAAMPWYRGPTVVEVLDAFANVTEPRGLPLRFPVQDVYKFDDRRIIAGRIESGSLKVGDQLLFSPTNKTARVRSIEAWHVPNPPSSCGPSSRAPNATVSPRPICSGPSWAGARATDSACSGSGRCTE